MPLSRTPYRLTAQQLDAALDALAKASETFRLSPRERFFYSLTEICTVLATLQFTLWIILVKSGLEKFLRDRDVSFGVVVYFGFLIGIVAAIAAPILLVMNFGLVWKTVKMRRLLKRLGLLQISDSVRKARPARHSSARSDRRLRTIVNVALLVAMTLTLWAGGNDWRYRLAFPFFVLIAAALVLWRFVQRSLERLQFDADSLRATLTSMRADAEDGFVVPAGVLENVAGIEHVRIARDRAHAIEAREAANRGYGVLFARDVSTQKTSLPADSRLEVEDLIERLASEPNGSGRSGVHGDGLRTARTPDGSAEVDYRVDQPNRRIHVVALRTLTHVI